MRNRVLSASILADAGDIQGAIDELTSFLEKVDGQSPPPDWMGTSDEKTAVFMQVTDLIEDLITQL